jgi:hypothetical protein
MNSKRFKLEDFKAEDTGKVTCIFSRFNMRDHDGDVTVPGAFSEGAPVRISQWGHGSWSPGLLPVGKGAIASDDTVATMTGQFFLKTQAGADTFEVVREMGDMQEWSYQYDPVLSDTGDFEGEQVRFLRKLIVNEVSPVMLGAGIGTRTTSVKSLADMTPDDLERQAIELAAALKAQGLPVPQELAELVRAADTAALLADRDMGTLLAIAAAHNITLEG